MKKPTGPARVETTATPAGAPVSGFAALLFNFDFDDAAVKAEHQAWLLEHAVPSLTAVPGAKVFLRGTASQVGNRDYNLQLSRRRVESVAGFLVAQGVARGQVVTSFTGEDLSASKLADDERDRAVEAIFEVSAGPARFERGFPIGANDGFDDGAEPPGIVVPAQSRSAVRLVDGAGAVVDAVDPGVVTVVDPSRPGANPVVATSNQFLVVLKPAVPGRTQLVAHFPQASSGSAAFERASFEPASFALFEREPEQILRRARRSKFDSRQIADRLIVQTLARRKVSVTLHYVATDGKGGQAPAGVRTARKPTPELEGQYIAYMNKIYLLQANIEFTLNPSRVVDSNGVPGPAVNAGIGGNRDKIFSTSKADKTAGFRVFFVGDISNGSLSVAASTLGQDCLCADVLRKAPLDEDVSTVGRILAHEMGHALGEGDDDRAGREALLMFGEDKGGEKIPLEQGTRMNLAAGRRK